MQYRAAVGDAIRIDGSRGEGGGQILRSSLSLSAITGRPLELQNIRANRRKPGLRRQHLSCVLAAAELTGAEVEGAEIGSRRVSFRPRHEAAPGEYRFDIGTAGSSTLLLQTVLWPLALAATPSTVIVAGGTHNPKAPPFEFLARSFAPLLRRAGVELGLELERCGFYPKGGGRIRATVAGPAGGRLEPFELAERGAERRRSALILLSRLPEHIARREAAVLRERLEIAEDDIELRHVKSPGPGNAVHAILEFAELTEVCTGFGERGVSAERVAAGAAGEALRYLDSGAAAGEHLADQLVIPLALAGGGAVRIAAPSLHTRTNIEVVSRFLETPLSLDEESGGAFWLRAG